jgi:hypothetical protein
MQKFMGDIGGAEFTKTLSDYNFNMTNSTHLREQVRDLFEGDFEI